MRLILKIRKKEKSDRLAINSRYDELVAVLLIVFSIFLYHTVSLQNELIFIYLCSFCWYIFALFLIIKVRMFSATGLHILYLLFFVQYGVFLQSVYYVFLERTIIILIFYNIVSPFVIMPLYRIKGFRQLQLKEANINQSWVSILYIVGSVSILLFFISVGSIPMLSADAENFRVQAVSGRGFLVVIAGACYKISVLLTSNDRVRLQRLVVSCALLLGTGYRSTALELILLVFITYYIGSGKKYLLQSVMVVVGLAIMYALAGVLRAGISWRWETLYMPVLWRLYVNSNNFDLVVRFFDTSRFLYGKSLLMDLAIVLPGAQDSFMLQLKEIMGYTYSGGSFTPTMFGEGYANWGTLGAVLWPIFAFVFVVLCDCKMRGKVDSRVYFALAFSLKFSTSSFFTTLLMGFIPLYIVYCGILFFSKHYEIKQCWLIHAINRI